MSVFAQKPIPTETEQLTQQGVVMDYRSVVELIESTKPRVAHNLIYPTSIWTDVMGHTLPPRFRIADIELNDELRHVIATAGIYIGLVRAHVKNSHALMTAVHYAITYGFDLQSGFEDDISVHEVVVWASYLAERFGDALENVTNDVLVLEVFYEMMHPNTIARSTYSQDVAAFYLKAMLSRLAYEWRGCRLRVGADEGLPVSGLIRELSHGAIVVFNGFIRHKNTTARIFVLTRLLPQDVKSDLRPDWTYAYLVARMVEERFNVPVRGACGISIKITGLYIPDDIHMIDDRIKGLFGVTGERPSFETWKRTDYPIVVRPLVDWRLYVLEHQNTLANFNNDTLISRTLRTEGWSRLREKYGNATIDDIRLDEYGTWLFYSPLSGVVYGRLFANHESLVIPDSVILEGVTVPLTGVASHAFENEPISNLSLSPHIQYVGSCAFKNTNLAYVRLQDVGALGRHVVSRSENDVAVVVSTDVRFTDDEPFAPGVEVLIQNKVVGRQLVSIPHANAIEQDALEGSVLEWLDVADEILNEDVSPIDDEVRRMDMDFSLIGEPTAEEDGVIAVVMRRTDTTSDVVAETPTPALDDESFGYPDDASFDGGDEFPPDFFEPIPEDSDKGSKW